MPKVTIFRSLFVPLVLVLNLAEVPAQTPPGEVQNLDLLGDTVSWDALAGTTAYNLYRGELTGLSASSYGACRAGAHAATSFLDPDQPLPDDGFFWLVTGLNTSVEGTGGDGNPGPIPRPLAGCTPNLRYNTYSLNGATIDNIIDGNEPRRNPNGIPVGRCSQCDTQAGYLTVWSHSGELFHRVVDLTIPGRGLDFVLERTYRNQILHDGTLGHGWRHRYETFIEPWMATSNIQHHDGRGHVDLYLDAGGGLYLPATPGLYRKIFDNMDGTLTLRERDGTEYLFNGWDGSNVRGALLAITDRNANEMTFLYDTSGNLATVVDTMGRAIQFTYDPVSGRLDQVTDFHNRTVTYARDVQNDLTAVTGPTVLGTPNGNDFPSGKTTVYGYSCKQGCMPTPPPELFHNLVSITAPNEVALNPDGPPRVSITYGVAGISFDRVTSMDVGDPNGSVPINHSLSYQILAGDPNDLARPWRKTTWTDRVGNVEEHLHNFFGNMVQRTELTSGVRATDPNSYVTAYEYNGDGERTRVLYPEQNEGLFTYDDSNPDRFQTGNLVEDLRLPDAGRGADQAQLQTTYVYEPIYNQLRSKCDPRGNDLTFVPPIDPGVIGCGRYSTVNTFDYEEACDFAALGARLRLSAIEAEALLTGAGMCSSPLGEINGDATTSQLNGNRIRTQRPTVHLDPGSNQAVVEGDALQEIVDLYRYNDLGQLLFHVDPELNLLENRYFPETDPDSDGTPTPPPPDGRTLNTLTGGYLRQVARDTASTPGRDSGTDPTPTNIRRRYLYDPVGNITSEVNGRGISTDYFVNELNQIVQITRPHSHNQLPVPEIDPPEPLPLTDFRYLEQVHYDFNDNAILRQKEDRHDLSSTGGFVDANYTFDILDDPVGLSAEVDSITQFLTSYDYDANQNRIRHTRPEMNFHTWEFDERDLLFRHTRGAGGPDPNNGLPSPRGYLYDGNGNLIQVCDADDTDLSIANNCDEAGFGDRNRRQYDGFDRLTSLVDSVGNQSVLQYDPAGNKVRVARFGPNGGPSPTSDPNTLMPVSLNGVLQVSNLASTNILESTVYTHDELNRTYQTDRALFAQTIPVPDISESGSALGKGDLAPLGACSEPQLPSPPLSGWLGCVSSRTEYDRRSRLTFDVEDDLDTTRFFYDGADRVINSVDPEGNSIESAYDDNDNLIERKETDISQIPFTGISGYQNEVFLTTYFYDSLDRLQRKVDNVGQTTYYRYDSRDNLVAMADAEGPITGSIARRIFAAGPKTVNSINGFGNVTHYSHDGLDRLTRKMSFLTSTGQGDDNIGVTDEGAPTTQPTRDVTQAGDGIITILHEWDDNSRRLAVTQDNGNRTEYSHDNLDRVVTETNGICDPPQSFDVCDPTTIITHAYDPDDNLEEVTDENGSITTCDFDAINRKSSCDSLPAMGVIGTTRQTFQYDGFSRLTRATDNNAPVTINDDVTEIYAYDSLSRLIQEAQGLNDCSSGCIPVPVFRFIDYSYRADMPSGVRYPNGRTILHSRDALDRLTSFADPNGPPIAQYDYIGRGGRLLEMSRLNQSRTLFGATALGAPDPNGESSYEGDRDLSQLYHVTDKIPYSGLPFIGFTYDSPAPGRNRIHQPLQQGKTHGSQSCDESYLYNSRYWLTDFERSAGCFDPSQSLFTLDGNGNFAEICDGTGFVCETRETSNFDEYTSWEDPNGLVSVIITDDNGNIVKDKDFRYAYDALDRLVKVGDRSCEPGCSPFTITLFSNVYGASGRRIQRRNAPTTDYIYADTRVLQENVNGVLDRQYAYGRPDEAPVAMYKNTNGNGSATDPIDEVFFSHLDDAGSTYGVSVHDSQPVFFLNDGFLWDAYGTHVLYTDQSSPGVTFDPNGDTVIPDGEPSSGYPYLFHGARREGFNLQLDEGGRGRYYHTTLGRYLSRAQTLGLKGDGRAPGNRYLFADNRPLDRLALVSDLDLEVIDGDYDRTEGLLRREIDPSSWTGSPAWVASISLDRNTIHDIEPIGLGSPPGEQAGAAMLMPAQDPDCLGEVDSVSGTPVSGTYESSMSESGSSDELGLDSAGTEEDCVPEFGREALCLRAYVVATRTGEWESYYSCSGIEPEGANEKKKKMELTTATPPDSPGPTDS